MHAQSARTSVGEDLESDLEQESGVEEGGKKGSQSWPLLVLQEDFLWDSAWFSLTVVNSVKTGRAEAVFLHFCFVIFFCVALK